MHTVYAAVYVCMLLAFCFFCFFAFGPSPHFETRRLLLRRYHASRWPLLPTTAHTRNVSLDPEAQKWGCTNAPSGRQVFSSRVADLGKRGLHDNAWSIDVLLDALVWQHTGAIAVDLITNCHVVTQHGHVLQPCPPAYRAVPADDRALDPRVLLHLRALQQHTPLQPHTVANDHVRSDRDIRANLAVLANGRRGVDHDVAAVNIGLRGRGQEVALLLRQAGEVEAGAGEEVLRLADIHPEALEVVGVQLAFLDDCWQCLLFDGGRSQLNALQHGGVEDVDTSVDAVAHELHWLLDEAVDS